MTTECPAGMVWNETALTEVKTCRGGTGGWFFGATRRMPRCECKNGTVLHEGKCIPLTKCPGKGNVELFFGPRIWKDNRIHIKMKKISYKCK